MPWPAPQWETINEDVALIAYFCDWDTRGELLDEEGQIDEVLVRPWVATWRSALKQLDAYPWTQLYPLVVHLEFRDRVFKALQTRQKKGLGIDWDLWGNVLDICIEQE